MPGSASGENGGVRAPAAASRPRTYVGDSASVSGPSRQRAASRSARPAGSSSKTSVPPTKRSDRSGGPLVAKLSKSRSASKVEARFDQVGVVDDQERALAATSPVRPAGLARDRGRHERSRAAEQAAELLGEMRHQLGGESAGKVTWTAGPPSSLASRRASRVLPEPGGPKSTAGPCAMLECIPQSAQHGVAAGHGDVGRRADRLAERAAASGRSALRTRGLHRAQTNVSAKPRSGTPPASRTSRARRIARSPVMPRW